MKRVGVALLAWCLLESTALLARGDGTFHSPFVITNAGRPGPATVHAGDFNGDGKLDLVTANGSPRILVYFQSPSSREEWRQLPLPVGSQVWFVRSADFTGDGLEDIVASDISATAYFVESLPGGAFKQPRAVPEARGSRWTAIGDWNNDSKLDFATANISAADITVFLGDGAGGFSLKQRLAGSREHTLEAFDYDADGIIDLFLGTGLTGITPHKGVGDGTFQVKSPFEYLGCVEYLAEVGHFEGGEYILHGDLDNDGRGDLAPTCVETTSASVGISRGDATFRRTIETQAGPDVDSSALADLNGDGNSDLALVSKGSTTLLVHLGKGDGSFLPDPVAFSPTGETPVFLIVRDLDRDGRLDAISADQLSSTITIFWGREGERFLESASSIGGFGAAKAMASADLDNDGLPDLFLPRSDRGEVNVYLGPAKSQPSRPSLTIVTQEKFALLEAADLDGDGAVDLAGADPISGKAMAALLDAAGAVRQERSMQAGINPASVEVGRLDAGASLDLAVPCRGSNHVAVFLGDGGGAFADAKILPTVIRPKGAALGAWNDDAFLDLAVISDTELVLHAGRGNGDFEAPREVLKDAAKLFTDVAAGDLDGDGKLDLLAAESKLLNVLVFKGQGGGAFDAPAAIRLSSAPASLVLDDLNGDGRLDITASSSSGRSASILLQEEALEFRSLVYGLGIVPVGHRLADFDGDGALDLAAFAASSATLLSGRRALGAVPLLRRGDANGDGRILLNDPVRVLNFLFQGGDPLPCPDAADANDDGAVNLTDPVAVLRYLFQGGGPPAAPGPDACGEDVGPDELGCDAECR